MISTKKTVFMIVVIVAGVFTSILAAEPNEPNEPNFPKTVVKFENDAAKKEWVIKGVGGQSITPSSPIKPAYVAEITLKGYQRFVSSNDEDTILRKILASPVSKKFSKEQQEFLKTEYAIRIGYMIPRLPEYFTLSLYAISSEDAKLMAQAIIDTLNTNAEKEFDNLKKKINRDKQDLAKAQKELPGIEKQLEEADKQYKEIKNATHQYSSDTEAEDMAKKSIIEMDKQLNLLNIELAGIREKVKTVERYKEKETMGSSTYAKLNEMYVELMVELSGLQARSEETEKIRQRERKFLNAYANLMDLHSKTNSIRSKVRDLPNVILDFSNRLKDTTPRSDASWLPPNVYRDTVLIYPVEIIHPVENRNN